MGIKELAGEREKEIERESRASGAAAPIWISFMSVHAGIVKGMDGFCLFFLGWGEPHGYQVVGVLRGRGALCFYMCLEEVDMSTSSWTGEGAGSLEYLVDFHKKGGGKWKNSFQELSYEIFLSDQSQR